MTRLVALAAVAALAVAVPLRADDDVAALVAQLKKGDDAARMAATRALGGLGKPAVGPVAELLADKDADVRYYAVWALGLIGPDAGDRADDVAKLLRDPVEDVRRKAAFSLGRIGPPDVAAPILVRSLDDNSLDVRVAVADAVARLGGPAVPALTEALKSPSARVRAHSAHALGQVGDAAADAAPALVKLLGDADPTVQFEAADAVARLGKAALPHLRKALESDRPAARAAAVRALRRTDEDEAADALLVALKSRFADVRTAAARALGEKRLREPRFVQALTAALEKDEDAATRAQAAAALGQLTAEAVEPAVPALKRALGDDSSAVRRAALEALNGINLDGVKLAEDQLAGRDAVVRVNAAALLLQSDPNHAEALKVLNAALASQEPPQRYRAAFAFAGLQRAPGETIDVLLRALKDEKPAVRTQAAVSLGLLGKEADRAQPALVVASRDSDPRVRATACRALARTAADPKGAMTALTAAFKDADADVRRAAFDAVWDRFGADGLPLYADALSDADASIRTRAANSIGFSGRAARDLIPKLVVAARKDDDPAVRNAAVQALTHLGDDAIPALAEVLAVPDPLLASAAMTALAQYGPKAKPAVSALVGVLKGDDATLRGQAAQTLGQIGPAAKDALAVLKDVAAKDPNPDVKAQAAEAVRLIEKK